MESTRVMFKEDTDTFAPDSYKLLMGSEVFSFIRNLKEKTFVASNGYEINCKRKGDVGTCMFTGRRLVIGVQGPMGFFKVHMARPSVVTADYREFKWKVDDLDVAVREAREAYVASEKRPGVASKQPFQILRVDNSSVFDVFLPEEVYDGLRKRKGPVKFGDIHLVVSDDCKPGFGNGSSDTLYLNARFRGRSIRLGHDFAGYGKLRKKCARLRNFFEELNQWLEITIDITGEHKDEPKPNPGKKSLNRLLLEALLEK